MGHVIKQNDIQDCQFLATVPQSSVIRLTDIGEAKITNTIFGKAKVRISHMQDKNRRAWLLTSVAAAAAAAAWGGWNALHQPVHIQPHAIPPSLSSEQSTQPQAISSTPVISQERTTLQTPGLKAPGQMAAKPVTALTASNPQKAPRTTKSNLSKDHLEMRQPSRQQGPIQPATPTITAPPAKQPASNAPSAVAPHVEPLIKDDSPTEPSSGDNQHPESVNVQP